MSLTQIRYKLDYLGEQCSPIVLQHIERALERAAHERSRHGDESADLLPQTLIDALAIDVAYAFVRHRYWMHTELFRLLLSEHLATSYRMAWRRSEAYVSETLQAVSEISPEPKEGVFPANDGEFLRYIFVATMCARDERSLIEDLGLGASTAAMARRALAAIDEDNDQPPHGIALCLHPREETSAAVYQTSADSERAQVMLALAEELKRKPLALDEYRLAYQLLDAEDPWRSLLRTHGFTWLTTWLCALGASPGMTTTSWLKSAKNTPQEVAVFLRDEAHLASLLHMLETRELIQRYPSAHKSKANKWTLLPLAQELTCRLFAADAPPPLLSSQKDFSNCCEAYQEALVYRDESYNDPCDDLRTDDLATRIAQGQWRPVSPKALSAALHKCLRRLDAATGAELLRAALVREQTPWLRKAVLNVLTSVPATDRIAQLLADVARSDGSQAMREAAFQALMRDA